MEAGYDYLLLRSRLQRRFIRASAIFLVITGVILLSAGIAYFVYAHRARSNLDDLNVSVTQALIPQGSNLGTEQPLNPPQQAAEGTTEVYVSPSVGLQESNTPLGELLQARIESPVSPTEVEAIPGGGGSNQLSQPPEGAGPGSGPPPMQVPEGPGDSLLPSGLEMVNQSPQISPSAIAAQQLYPGEALKASYWNNPLGYEPTSHLESSFIQGFKPVDPSMAAPVGTLSAPTRIIIPSIIVDSQVTGLRVLNLGDSRAYETPKNVVGHIPQSANPGEKGGVWLFGHLESPIEGEGNVFYTLPKIAELLRRGEEVYAIIESAKASYLYRIVESRVVHQDDMRLYDTGGPTIHLVTCVPKWVYDHRLIVTGKLVGIRN